MNTFAWKRTLAAVMICMLTFSSSAWAAGTDEQTTPTNVAQQKRMGLYKIIAGAAVASIGFMFIANSHESATVRTSVGTFSASATNKGGMVAGIGLLGAGGLLVALGVKDRKASPSVGIGVNVGRTNGVFLRRQW